MTDDINHLPAQTMKDLQVNHTYLVRFSGQETLFSIKVLLVTDKAYHLKWNDNNETWELKDVLYKNYNLIEDISDFVSDKSELKEFVTDTKYNVKTKLVQCHVCKGFGTVPAPNTTAGNTSCPLCFGSKMIPEVTEINQE